MSRRLFPGKRRTFRAREQTDPKIFATRHRFLLVPLLAQVPLLAVVGLTQSVPPDEIVVASMLLVVMAAVGMVARGQSVSAAVVALGLVTGAGILVRYLDGSPASLFAFFLALVAISFYQNTRLLLVGLVYVAAYQFFAFAVLYRESAIFRAGVVDVTLPVAAITLDLLLVGLLMAGWRLAARSDDGGAVDDALRAGFERANVGMAMLTPAGDFVQVNGALIGMLGYQPGHLSGSNIRGVIHSDDLDVLGQTWEEMGNASDQTATAWMRCRTGEGQAIWARVSLAFVRGARRRPATILLQIDEASQTRAEQRRLESQITGRDEFVAAIADDIRGPIGSVVELASLTDTDPIDLHRAVREIEGHARQVASIVDDLVISARADLALPVMSRSVDAGLLCLESLADVPGAVDIALAVEATALWVDPGLTVRILDRLVANALRYGGSRVRIETAASGPDTVISVIDDGPSVPVPERERIFESDLRSGRPVTRPAAVGLSLTVARRLARLMDGDIVYRRTGDGHNVFELRLPSEPVRAGQDWLEVDPVRIPA